MPVTLLFGDLRSFRAGIWSITETEEELISCLDPNETNPAGLSSIRHPVRRKQWLASRLILSHLLRRQVHLIYDTNGKPHLEGSSDPISITHSGDQAAAAIGIGTPVGIDIESVRPRILKVASRFLSQEEEDALKHETSLEKYYVCWCAKEAIYKLYGIPLIDFRDDITIHPFVYLCNGEGLAEATIRNGENFQPTFLYYRKTGSYMLSVATLSPITSVCIES